MNQKEFGVCLNTRAEAPVDQSVLYLFLQLCSPKANYARLYLYIFRGEPAISGFDWNFSATHSSSIQFDT